MANELDECDLSHLVNKRVYYMATIVLALSLAGERARFSCNNRAL